MTQEPMINTIDILRHAFVYQDTRLTHHGERVAYILWKLLSDHPYYTRPEKQSVFLLGLFHDIGAYREAEIDAMLSFDTQDSIEHSIFGYLLLKSFSPLAEYADCILYHHNHNAQYYSVPLDSKHRDIAKLLYLADRIDIFLLHNRPDTIGSFLHENAFGSVFSRKDFDLFLESNRRYRILDHIADGEYLKELSEYTRQEFPLTGEENLAYFWTYLFSVDFQNEYSALHTSYAVHFCQCLSRALLEDPLECQTALWAAMLLYIGKSRIPASVRTSLSFEGYLQELNQPDIENTTNAILSGGVSQWFFPVLEQSFQLLRCFWANRPISFAPTPAAEITALSYLMSNQMNHPKELPFFTRQQHWDFLVQKYNACGLNRHLLNSFGRHYDSILPQAKAATDADRNSYHKLLHEEHALRMILLHYNKKYFP